MVSFGLSEILIISLDKAHQVLLGTGSWRIAGRMTSIDCQLRLLIQSLVIEKLVLENNSAKRKTNNILINLFVDEVRKYKIYFSLCQK